MSYFLSCDLVRIPYLETKETTLRKTLNLIFKMFFFRLNMIFIHALFAKYILVLTMVFVQK